MKRLMNLSAVVALVLGLASCASEASLIARDEARTKESRLQAMVRQLETRVAAEEAGSKELADRQAELDAMRTELAAATVDREAADEKVSSERSAQREGLLALLIQGGLTFIGAAGIMGSGVKS